jgi:hypothetical protein
MIHTETKFAIKHIPSQKWVYLETFTNNPDVYIHLLDEVPWDNLYRARNIMEEDLMRSIYNGEKYAMQNWLEFEFVEVECMMKVLDMKEKVC